MRPTQDFIHSHPQGIGYSAEITQRALPGKRNLQILTAPGPGASQGTNGELGLMRETHARMNQDVVEMTVTV